MTLRSKYLLLAPCLVFASIAILTAQQWPEGPGKEITIQLCVNCHSADIVQAHRMTRDEWTSTIQKMIMQGAEGTPEQFNAVLDYLTKNFGPAAPHVKINEATAADLLNGLSLSEKEAAALVKYRTANGPFKTLDDLKKVPDLDFKKIEAAKDRIDF
jgi:competence protein ComEA